MYPRFDRRKNRPRFPSRWIGLIGALLLLSTALLIAACSSDDPSAVGAGLVDANIDSLLVPINLTGPIQYRGIPIKDDDIPLWDQEVLYLGGQEGDSSSILVQYDFDQIIDENVPIGLFTLGNVSSVKIRLFMLTAYSIGDENEDEVYPWHTVYQVYHLDAPIDSLAYPGPDPVTSGLVNLNTSNELDNSKTVNVDLHPSELIDWVTTGGMHTFSIKEGAGSGDGLVGYAAMDMVHGGSTLEPTIELDSLGPSIIVKFADPDTVITIAPSLDMSTFSSVSEVPTTLDDGFFLRTGLRVYPALRFDFSVLPEDVFINRAVLSVTNDTTRSWGTLESIVVSEFPVSLFGAEGDSLPLADLGDAIYPVTGFTSLDPTYNYRMDFNVTSSIQRMINGLHVDDLGAAQERGFILTAGEDFLPNYDTTSLDPDFYFNQFIFFGITNPDTLLRPSLKITYSVNETIQGGGK